MSISEHVDGRSIFTTTGMRFRQNPKSPEQFAFVASANDLIKFCGVARKSQDLLSNYQRALDEARIREQVTPFFRDPENCTPTAVVVSLQNTNVCEIEFKNDDKDVGSVPISDELTIRFANVDEMDVSEVVRLSKEFLDGRLRDDDVASEENEDDESGSDVEEDDGSELESVEEDADNEDELESVEEDADNEDELESDEPVEIGKSMLRELRNRLDEETAFPTEMIESLREMLKPALVIDGQHRLFGAAGVEEDIPLLVCSLVRPTWKEQVFQFVVVNDKAAGIPKPFITSLAGMSLTGQELTELQDRLTQAGLKLWEVEVMQRLGYDSRSPFREKIEFKVSGGSESKGLGYQTMKRVGKAWHQPRSPGLYTVMDKLYRGPADKKLTQKALRGIWQSNDDWFDFFCEFWRAFEEKFEGTEVWEMHSNLLTAVVLEYLQKDFLLYLDSTKDLVWDFDESDDDKRRAQVLGKFRTIVNTFVNNHKKATYTKEWKMKTLNHSSGKKALADLFQKIRNGTSLANHAIFTGVV